MGADEVPPDRRISFRIGVHIGDLMVRAADLFGDGVKIAARLQTLASPGAVCISGATYDQVRKVLPQVYRTAGLPEEAVQSFERANRMSPIDPLLYRLLTGMGMAFVELGRFDEAIVAGKKDLRQNPSYSLAHRCLAVPFAHLGRDVEAREAAARVLEFDPAFTISAWIARGGQSNAKLLIEGLRKAGLPE